MTEFELKLEIPAHRTQAVEAAVRRGRTTRQRLQARYFDTHSKAMGNEFRDYIFQNQLEVNQQNLRGFAEKFGSAHKVDLPFVIAPGLGPRLVAVGAALAVVAFVLPWITSMFVAEAPAS